VSKAEYIEVIRGLRKVKRFILLSIFVSLLIFSISVHAEVIEIRILHPQFAMDGVH